MTFPPLIPKGPQGAIQCYVYHDEREVPKEWLYHGFLFVPADKRSEVIRLLNNEREKSKWHKEIHFQKLSKTHSMNKLAVAWAKLFCEELYRSTYFYILGVDYINLNKELWRDRRTRDSKIYNRFFAIGLKGAISWFFKDPTAGHLPLTIIKIFSDFKPRSPSDPFHEKPIKTIWLDAFLEDRPITFASKEVIEINSDHEKELQYPEDAHLIQYTDLILGGFSQAFDFTSKDKGKCCVADVLLAYNLPRAIMGLNALTSQSQYYRRYGISFFPKKRIDKKTREQMRDPSQPFENMFYYERELKYKKAQRSVNPGIGA